MIAHTSAKIIGKDDLSPTIRLFTLHNPDIAKEAKPGQFIHINVNHLYHPLMRRPISIFSADGNATFQILFKVIGEGTNILSEKEIGDELDIISPLGNAYSLNDNKEILCIAGGIGIAPIFFLLNHVKKNYNNIKSTLIFGGRTIDDIIFRSELNSISDKMLLVTEDGLVTNKGYVTDYLEPYLDENIDIYVCGPMPMVKRIKEIIGDRDINCYVSLEERMGCGFGVCRGCAVNTVDGYKTVCKDGPVLNLKELVM